MGLRRSTSSGRRPAASAGTGQPTSQTTPTKVGSQPGPRGRVAGGRAEAELQDRNDPLPLTRVLARHSAGLMGGAVPHERDLGGARTLAMHCALPPDRQRRPSRAPGRTCHRNPPPTPAAIDLSHPTSLPRIPHGAAPPPIAMRRPALPAACPSSGLAKRGQRCPGATLECVPPEVRSEWLHYW